MAKLNVLQEGRDQGMAFAYQIALKAQSEGKDPAKAIDDELHLRRQRDIVTLRTAKEVEHDNRESVYLAYKVAMVISMATLWGEFGWGGIKRLPRFVDAYIRYIVEIGKGIEAGGSSLDEIIETLDKEAGVMVNLDSKDLAVDFRKRKHQKDKIY